MVASQRAAWQVAGIVAAAVLIAVGVVAVRGAARAAHGTTVVVEINSERDITIWGREGGEEAGMSVAVGDLNNDGILDLVVGAPYARPGGLLRAGRVSVIFGPFGPGTLNVFADADLIIDCVTDNYQMGWHVATGDVDGDGDSDLIALGRGDSRTFFYFGPLETGTLHPRTDADIDIKSFDGSNRGAVAVGDVNNDGTEDLILDGRVGTNVLFGPLVAGSIVQSNELVREGQSDLGRPALGDLNGDGVADLAIAAPGASAGMVYVLFGPLERGQTYPIAAADITIVGITAGDQAGNGVAIGDVNNDGASDLIIGAWLADGAGRSRAGETYVVFVPLGPDSLKLAEDADMTFLGTAADDQAGADVAAVDLNGDGAGDVIIGANQSGLPSLSGAVYVMFGEPPETRAGLP